VIWGEAEATFDRVRIESPLKPGFGLSGGIERDMSIRHRQISRARRFQITQSRRGAAEWDQKLAAARRQRQLRRQQAASLQANLCS